MGVKRGISLTKLFRFKIYFIFIGSQESSNKFIEFETFGIGKFYLKIDELTRIVRVKIVTEFYASEGSLLCDIMISKKPLSMNCSGGGAVATHAPISKVLTKFNRDILFPNQI